MRLSLSAFFAIFLSLLAACDDKTVDKCEEEGAPVDECEFRIIETNDETTYSLGDIITVRSDRNTFGSNKIVDMNLLSNETARTCGGTLVSLVAEFKVTDEQGEIEPRDNIKDKQLYVRMDSSEVIETRDESLYAFIMRVPPSSEVYYIDSTTYQPRGDNAVGETDVNFYTDETHAAFYLVNAPDGLDGSCQVYQTLEQEEATTEGS